MCPSGSVIPKGQQYEEARIQVRSLLCQSFEYEFTFAPMGDNGVYEYIEPWYGFAVNTNSDAKDYAVEFLRFMAREDQLNTPASVKGVPSIAKNAPDERYSNLNSMRRSKRPPCVTAASRGMWALLVSSAADLAGGVTADTAAALEEFVSACAESAQGN